MRMQPEAKGFFSLYDNYRINIWLFKKITAKGAKFSRKVRKGYIYSVLSLRTLRILSVLCG